jgi:shikimate dehydrogenase
LNRLLAAAGHNAVLVPWHAKPASFRSIMQGLMQTANLDGIAVTYPFKLDAVGLADEVLPRARQVGAINALRRRTDGAWEGDMFDGVGLVRALEQAGRPPRGTAVRLVGAGGAGSAIAFALAAAGVARLAVHDLDRARAEALACAVSEAHRACQVTPHAGPAAEDIVINATPLGLRPDDPLPMDVETLPASVTVVDIVSRSGGTRFLGLAAARGCRIVEGAAMVEGQAAALLDFFGFGPTRLA